MFRCAVHQNEFTTFGNENRIFFFPFFKRRQLLYKFRSGGKGRESCGLAEGLPLK